jgi:hypothetical protein
VTGAAAATGAAEAVADGSAGGASFLPHASDKPTKLMNATAVVAKRVTEIMDRPSSTLETQLLCAWYAI